jgi:hypothetical protein
VEVDFRKTGANSTGDAGSSHSQLFHLTRTRGSQKKSHQQAGQDGFRRIHSLKNILHCELQNARIVGAQDLPNVLLVRVDTGSNGFSWFNTLNASPRSSSACPSRIGNFQRDVHVDTEESGTLDVSVCSECRLRECIGLSQREMPLLAQ